MTERWRRRGTPRPADHAAAVGVLSGELRRARSGGGAVVLVAGGELPGPVHACYEAGPTGFGLYRAARRRAAGGGGRAEQDAARAGDRVKTDRATLSSWCAC